MGWLPVALLAVPALLYARGVRRVGRKGRGWPSRRAAVFLCGLLGIGAALAPPLASHDSTSFTAHAVQHLLLTMAAPPLLALGAPVTLLLQASGRPTRRRILSIVHGRVVGTLAHPVTGWLLFAVSMAAVYLTPLYPLSLRHEALHDLLHVHMVLTGALFWWPIVGLDPLRRPLAHGLRLLYVVAALPVHGFIAVALLDAASPLATSHTLADQRFGAGVMWAAGDVIGLLALGVVVVQWMAADEREAARIDRQLSLGAGSA